MGYTILAVITHNKNDSLRAVHRAISVAKGSKGSNIRLMYMYPVMANQMDANVALDFQHEISRESEEAFLEPTRLLEQAGISYGKYIGIGNLIHEVRIEIQLNRCKLLVLAASLGDALIGDSKKLAKKVTCPVLLV